MAAVLSRLRTVFLSDTPPEHINFRLNRQWSLKQGLDNLRNHKWRYRDLQYLVMVPVLIFCLVICDVPILPIRLAIAGSLAYLMIVPALSQFWLNFMPVGSWLILFYSCRYISPEWRPSIYVRVLPGLESILYGGNLSAVLASKTASFLDILAWIPYGLIHFGAPAVLSMIFFLFGPPTILPVFMFAFGYMNLVGVFIQLLFPNAPPWYQEKYGLQKANYAMLGSPGGLARIDQIIGINLYSEGFTNSPLVFGAFPSLHSGSAVMEALFVTYLFPKLGPFVTVYVLWIWWATMYLTHHYFIDLIGGAMLSLVVFYACRLTIMPRPQYDKFSRWSYDHVDYGLKDAVPKFRKSFDEEASEFYELRDIRDDDPRSEPNTGSPLQHSRSSTPVSAAVSMPTRLVGTPVRTSTPVSKETYDKKKT